MPLDDLPPEIIDLIASFLLLIESPKKSSHQSLCYHTDDANDHQHSTKYRSTTLLPSKSTVFRLASVSRHLRDVLFTSRGNRFVKVKFDGRDYQKATGINLRLLAKVSKLRIIATPHPYQSPSSETSPKSINKYQGMGDVLQPYYALQHLEIDWYTLRTDDPRIQAMRTSANALPVMKFDLRCSRACTLWTVQDLHIKLSSREGGDIPIQAEEGRLSGQLDLILQQFDLPDLRTLHISHDFNGDMDAFSSQWTEVLPEVRLQYWPRLEAVNICVAASYRFLSVDGTMQGVELPRWQPLVQSILDHLASSKKPLKANIAIVWKFNSSFPSPFNSRTEGQSTLREQIMPTAESFDTFVQELQGRAKERPFTLQIRGSSGTNKDDSKRLLQATYNPGAANQPGPPYAEMHERRLTTFELDQAEIERLRLPAPVPPPPHNRGRYIDRNDPHRVWQGTFNQRMTRVLAQDDDMRQGLDIEDNEIVDVEEEEEPLEEEWPAPPTVQHGWMHQMFPDDRYTLIHRQPPPAPAQFLHRGRTPVNFGSVDLVGATIERFQSPAPIVPPPLDGDDGVRAYQSGQGDFAQRMARARARARDDDMPEEFQEEEKESLHEEEELREERAARPIRWYNPTVPEEWQTMEHRHPSPPPAQSLYRGLAPVNLGAAIKRFRSPPLPPLDDGVHGRSYQSGQVDFSQRMIRAMAQDDLPEEFESEEEEETLEEEDDLGEGWAAPPTRWDNFTVPEDREPLEQHQPSPPPSAPAPAQLVFGNYPAFAAQPPRWLPRGVAPGGRDPFAAYLMSVGDTNPRPRPLGAAATAMDVNPAAEGLEWEIGELVLEVVRHLRQCWGWSRRDGLLSD